MKDVSDANLFAMRVKTHDAVDALWRTKRMTRTQTYNWLARHMKLAPKDCHIGNFDVQQCHQAISAARAKLRQLRLTEEQPWDKRVVRSMASTKQPTVRARAEPIDMTDDVPEFED